MSYENSSIYYGISTEGIVNVIESAGFSVSPHWDRKRIVEKCDMLIDIDAIDEIELILEADGE